MSKLDHLNTNSLNQLSREFCKDKLKLPLSSESTLILLVLGASAIKVE